MNRVRGRRFDEEPKLNMKKVIATIVAFIVLIMVIVSIKNLFTGEKKVANVMSFQTTYFTMYDNGKYGVIDNTGKEVIKPTYDEMIVIPNPIKDIFICTYDIDYSAQTYKTKVLNASGKEILTNYSKVQVIENKDANKIWYEDNILIYEKDGLYGLIDFAGKKITEAEYTNIYALEGIAKSIVIEKDGKKGIVNSSLGQVVLECKYSDISIVSETADDGYIVNLNGKYGIISASGKTVLEPQYKEIKHVTGNNMYAVVDDAGNKIIDSNLNVIIDNGFEDVKSIDGENIIIKNGDKFGVINKSNEAKIPVEYEDLKYSYDNYYIAKKNGLYGIISLDNVVCTDFSYTSLDFIKSINIYTAERSDYTTDVLNKNLEVKLSGVIISELNLEKDYMRIRKDNDYKYYNFNFNEKNNIDILKSNTLFLVKKDGKYGYVNNNSELIVDYKYDDAKEQNDFGYCAVKKDGVWGVLNYDGTVVLEPSINLDDNLYVEFIGKWHLYNDADFSIYIK